MKNKMCFVVIGFVSAFMTLFGCSYKDDVIDKYIFWKNKKIKFPHSSTWTIYASDTVDHDTNKKLKIVNYIDSVGCIGCKSQLPLWGVFFQEVESKYQDLVSLMIYMNTKSIDDATNTIRKSYFSYPICVDFHDSLNILNDFPTDGRFRCFLLDSTNRVILIGNPVQNPKIKELYLRTISERLGIEYNQNSDAKMDSKTEINLGSFPKSESKSVQFFIPNNTESEMQIDTVFTSCECTTAKIDKMSISPHQNASLSVTYTPDGSGEFFREVYVKVRGEDKPKTFAIRGNVE